MKDYKETQYFWMIFVFMVPLQLWLIYLFIYNIGNNHMGITSFIIAQALFASIYFLLYGMTTHITYKKIRIAFGIGIIRFNIPLRRIATVTAVKNPWYYGWGIRFIPGGMLYNISGSLGVELEFNDSKRVTRIGTKDPQQLKQEIESRLAQSA
ncbi:MAG: hypothetical protein WAU36_03110 [Cyclobacteriaceae bacterium]